MNTLEKIVQELFEAQNKFDPEKSRELGRPCTPKQIESLEKILGKPLPPSYRSFMELHNGWTFFNGEAKLLSVEDQKSKWVKDRVKDLDSLFQYNKVESPFKNGAIPIVLGKDERTFVVLDPHKVRSNGEMNFVAFDYATEEYRIKDFTAFLKDEISSLKKASKY